MMRIVKFALVALVLVFMVAIYLSGTTPQMPLASLAETLQAQEPTAALEAADAQKTVRYLGLYPEDCQEIHYWRSADGMNASELAIVQEPDSSRMSAVRKALEKRVSDQLGAFEGYAPEQEAKLKNHVLRTRGDYLLYAVGTDEELKSWEGAFDGIQ